MVSLFRRFFEQEPRYEENPAGNGRRRALLGGKGVRRISSGRNSLLVKAPRSLRLWSGYQSDLSNLSHTKEWAALARALRTRVTQERGRQGFAKTELGRRNRLASRYVWRVEKGLQNIQLSNIGKVAMKLAATLTRMLDGVDHCGFEQRQSGGQSSQAPRRSHSVLVQVAWWQEVVQ